MSHESRELALSLGAVEACGTLINCRDNGEDVAEALKFMFSIQSIIAEIRLAKWHNLRGLRGGARYYSNVNIGRNKNMEPGPKINIKQIWPKI